MFERLKFWKSSEQKQEVDVTESVKDSELRSCLSNLAREEQNVLRDAPKGAKAYRDILQSVLKIQLALKEYEEQVRIPLSIAKDAVRLASHEQKTKKEAELKVVQSTVFDKEGVIRWNVSYIAEQIKDFELKYSKTIAESMRKAVRVTMLKLASQFRVSQKRIALLRSKGAWF